jgi:phosphonate transport system ATP-binding protein
VLQNVIAGRLGRRGSLGALRDLLRPSRSDTREIHRILERVGIGERLYERTDRLSGGEQQRVAIARALFQQPAALLADEPVSSVDPARARDTVSLLAELSAERDLTLCMSLHNLDLAREFFPRLVGLRRGSSSSTNPLRTSQTPPSPNSINSTPPPSSAWREHSAARLGSPKSRRQSHTT